MNSIIIHTLCIAALTAGAAALPGVFLVLRGASLMSDAISHAILLGIVGMFLLVRNIHSPLLIVGAALAGVATVVCTQALIHSKRLKEDAAIGLVFPLFFSLGIILITLYTRDVHLDSDMVLLGDITFAPLNRLEMYGVDCGPYACWVMGIIFGINLLFVTLFYKELKIATFDPSAAALAGFSPNLLYYGLMSLTSITAVGAFDVVGAIVIVALMITAPATAFLLVKRLSHMLALSVALGALAACTGCLVACWFDVSIVGAIATVLGLLFGLVAFMTGMRSLLL